MLRSGGPLRGLVASQSTCIAYEFGDADRGYESGVVILFHAYDCQSAWTRDIQANMPRFFQTIDVLASLEQLRNADLKVNTR